MRIPSLRRAVLPLAGVLLALTIGGCGDEPQPTTAKQAPVTPQSERERAIDNTQAASAVGYDGEGLKASVQRTVNTLDQQKARSQQAIDSAAGQPAADGARGIAAGAWDRPLPMVGSGEVRELARELERMRLRLLELDAAHRQAERLATLGTFTATIAHEVRNPLSAVRLTVQLLARRLPGDPGLELIIGEIERLDLIVDELLGFSRGMTVRTEPTDLAEVVAGVLRLLRRQADHAGIALVTVDARATGARVLADPQRLRQLLLNLVLNAIQAAQQGSGTQVRVTIAGDGLSVEDDGPGVPPDLVPRLFEAFASGRAEGTGLGLHLAKAIADAHGCTLRHEPVTPGARFVLSGLTLAPA